jgi:hypothetical protein
VTNKEQKTLPQTIVTTDKVLLNGALRIPIPTVSDWLIVQPELDKPRKALVQVVKVSKDAVGVVLEKGREKEDTEQRMTLPLNQVFLNLGPAANTDFVGMSVMGVKLEFFVKRKETSLGPAYFLTEVSKENWQVFKKGVERTKEILGSMHMLDKLAPIEFYFPKPGGQYSGMYYVTGEELDRIDIRLKEYSPKYVLWVLLHEFCHGVHAYMLSKEEWAGWIRLYHRYVKVKHDTEIVDTVLEDYLAKGEDYEPGDDDQEMVFDECINFIADKHFLEKEYLDDLLRVGDQDTIRRIWPKTADLAEQEEAITEYAKKNPVEFFCEAFAFYNMGEKSRASLPKVVAQKMEADLAAITKRNRAKGQK